MKSLKDILLNTQPDILEREWYGTLEDHDEALRNMQEASRILKKHGLTVASLSISVLRATPEHMEKRRLAYLEIKDINIKLAQEIFGPMWRRMRLGIKW